jgi:hypothetical protein
MGIDQKSLKKLDEAGERLREKGRRRRSLLDDSGCSPSLLIIGLIPYSFPHAGACRRHQQVKEINLMKMVI